MNSKLAISILLNVILLIALFNLYTVNQRLKGDVELVVEQNRNLSMEVDRLMKQVEMLNLKIKYYEDIARQGNAFIPYGEVVGSSEMCVTAVRTISHGFFSYEYEGVVLILKVELREGEGRVLVNTRPKIGIELQASAEEAFLAAENYLGVNLSSYDVIITIEAGEPVEIVDGPSIGSAIAVSIVSAYMGKAIESGAIVTGTINRNGQIGPVGGVAEKALAAAEHGAKLFIVPKGQEHVMISIPKTYEVGPGFTVTYYEYKEISLQEWVSSHGYNMTIVSVSTLSELAGILLGSGANY